jgi:hypothetical protein
MMVMSPRSVLYSAYLRLQLNYYMADNYLPSINDTTVDVAANICASYSNGTSYSCVMWNYFFQCLNLPSNWKYYKGGVYMPYTWVEESVVMDEDTASGIKDLNDLKIFKKDLETWSFVVGGQSLIYIYWICLYSALNHTDLPYT